MGLIPHKDFTSSYGFLFPYFFGFINATLGYDGWYILLILMDTIILGLIIKNTTKDQFNRSWIIWFWLLNPLILWNTIINGQQQILIALLGMLVLNLASEHKYFALLMTFLGIVLTKIMMLIYVPSIILSGNYKEIIKTFIVLIIALTIFYTTHHAFNLNFLEGLKGESAMVTPGSILFWVHALFNTSTPIAILNLTSIGVSSFFAFWIYTKLPTNGSNNGIVISVILMLVFFTLGPRIYSSYYVMIIPLLMVNAILFNLEWKFFLHAMIICTFGPAEASLYFALNMPKTVNFENLHSVLPLFLCDAIIIYCNIILTCTIISRIRSNINKQNTNI